MTGKKEDFYRSLRAHVLGYCGSDVAVVEPCCAFEVGSEMYADEGGAIGGIDAAAVVDGISGRAGCPLATGFLGPSEPDSDDSRRFPGEGGLLGSWLRGTDLLKLSR